MRKVLAIIAVLLFVFSFSVYAAEEKDPLHLRLELLETQIQNQAEMINSRDKDIQRIKLEQQLIRYRLKELGDQLAVLVKDLPTDELDRLAKRYRRENRRLELQIVNAERADRKQEKGEKR